MIFWIVTILFLLHAVWRISKSTDRFASHTLFASYCSFVFAIRWLSPFFQLKPSLYLPLLFPYALIGVCALFWLLLNFIDRLLPNHSIMSVAPIESQTESSKFINNKPDRKANMQNLLLNRYFISILSIHCGFLFWGLLIGWKNIFIAYATLPVLICCITYFSYRLLLFCTLNFRKKFPILICSTFIGIFSAAFIIISSDILLPIISLICSIFIHKL